ncbi:ACP S-malonyltransferase [Streptomyces cinnamoneus]|uniref:Malonyl CoA-acyl carrier protein transacylase n=1 Tax=Streptomyces cinnamoneus TaxID=53446 RepID=A0A918TZ08_STRCJ|nr:ACP S-malonyltransferase [Streptomyces cinnamoneus]GHC63098.1 malonyl CoA-acyl carrier protein transacylase [Streptomyces cinnamoneus]
MNSWPVGLVFPGQGTQRQGMGEPWRDTPSWDITEEVSLATGEDLAELLLHTPSEELRRTDLAQLTVFTVAVMAHAEAVRRGLLTGPVAACAGHSLGEYAALTAAGALPLADAATLVAARGRAMQAAAQQREGTMGVLVRAPLAEVEQLVGRVREAGAPVWVANVNGPGQIVVSGSPEAIEHISEEASSIGARMIRLQVGGAFHSPYMEPAAEALRIALKNTSFAPRHTPVVANVDAEPYSGDGDWAELGTRQLTSPVQWERSVHTLTGPLGCRRLVEFGHGRTLAGLIRRIVPETEVVSVDSPDALDQLQP